jgi:hypothetical protein
LNTGNDYDQSNSVSFERDNTNANLRSVRASVVASNNAFFVYGVPSHFGFSHALGGHDTWFGQILPSLVTTAFGSFGSMGTVRFGAGTSAGNAMSGKMGEMIIAQGLEPWQIVEVKQYLHQKWSLVL